eukprot:3408772-Amphidinium_carterae.1
MARGLCPRCNCKKTWARYRLEKSRNPEAYEAATNPPNPKLQRELHSLKRMSCERLYLLRHCLSRAVLIRPSSIVSMNFQMKLEAGKHDDEPQTKRKWGQDPRQSRGEGLVP